MHGVYFFPRSLRQLVLLAFLLVILPLLFLAIKAYRSLETLGNEAAYTNQVTLNAVQRGEMMTNLSLSMERAYRQYCVLKDVGLAKLYHEQFARYNDTLNQHREFLSSTLLYSQLKDALNTIEQLDCGKEQPSLPATKAIEHFSSLNNALLQETRQHVFTRGERLQHSIAKQGEFFGQWTMIVFILSITLVLLFTHMIIGPVKAVNHLITQLGDGNFIKEGTKIKGPQELRQLGQQIIWLSKRLAWLESQRHQFLRHLSHELKTPLASMREGTELLMDQIVGQLTTDQREVVKILDESSRHLQQLIEQLLDYNRNLTERKLEYSQLDLAQMINGVITTHQLSAKAKQIKTECQLSITTWWGEEKLLLAIIDNLYSNAVHYGAESGTIWIISYRDENDMCIDIANSGTPIAEKDKPMLFEPFYQGSRSRKGAVKGSGLGLSIARDCIKHLQGSLLLVDVDYAATCFRIRLPLRRDRE